MPDVLFRGPIDDVSPWLQPVAHGLLQAGEDVEKAFAGFEGDLWARPGGAASPGWHLVHLIGATDRLFSYALGHELSPNQRAWLDQERAGRCELGPGELVAVWQQTLDHCLASLRDLQDETLLESRAVGAAGLPSTTLGLLVHASEHCQRHSGQIVTTLKITRGLDAEPAD